MPTIYNSVYALARVSHQLALHRHPRRNEASASVAVACMDNKIDQMPHIKYLIGIWDEVRYVCFQLYGDKVDPIYFRIEIEGV